VSLAPSAREELAKLARTGALGAGRSSRPAEAEFSAGSRVTEPSLDRTLPLSKPINGRSLREEPSFVKRALRRVFRFVLTAGIGVAATLAWQSHGDEARQIVAEWAAQRGWSSWLPLVGLPSDLDVARRQVTPSTPQVPDPPQPETVAAAPPSAPQLEAMAQDSAAMRQKLEQLAAGQEQLAAGRNSWLKIWSSCRAPCRRSSKRRWLLRRGPMLSRLHRLARGDQRCQFGQRQRSRRERWHRHADSIKSRDHHAMIC